MSEVVEKPRASQPDPVAVCLCVCLCVNRVPLRSVRFHRGRLGFQGGPKWTYSWLTLRGHVHSSVSVCGERNVSVSVSTPSWRSAHFVPKCPHSGPAGQSAGEEGGQLGGQRGWGPSSLSLGARSV